MSLASFVRPVQSEAKQMLEKNVASLHRGSPHLKMVSCVLDLKHPPVFFKIVPAFVLTQILQRKLAQIKPHPFFNLLKSFD